eukprot:360102-Chlamydomonas_euryale.AAC.8
MHPNCHEAGLAPQAGVRAGSRFRGSNLHAYGMSEAIESLPFGNCVRREDTLQLEQSSTATQRLMIPLAVVMYRP